MAWTVADIPDLTGHHAIVTGTGGIGLEAASALAGAGADVVVAGRDPAKGRAALERIQADHPDATVRFETLDLASLASVKAFAERMVSTGYPIDILIANAGIMALPRRQETEDGFERQFGVNYLGHFALVGHLLLALRSARTPRVVTVSSLAHRGGHIRLDDLQSTRRYRPFTAYSQSKLAMLMFALELQRRSDASGWGLKAIAAHPGGAKTNLIANGPGRGFSAWPKVLAQCWQLLV